MHNQRIEIWRHKHNFNLEKRGNESRTSMVVIITFVTMVVEIIMGWLTNSMALYADGWHMGTHAFAQDWQFEKLRHWFASGAPGSGSRFLR